MSQAGGDPSPKASERGSTEPPGSGQISLSVRYTHGSPRHLRPDDGSAPRLEVAVAGRPSTLLVETGDIQGSGPPERLAGDGTVYLAWHPLSTDAVSQSAYAAHRYVAAFSFVTNYATQRTPTASATPPPSSNGLPPCISGSLCN
jgi:hypothetical protein